MSEKDFVIVPYVISKEAHRQFKILCKKNHISMSDVVRELIKNDLGVI